MQVNPSVTTLKKFLLKRHQSNRFAATCRVYRVPHTGCRPQLQLLATLWKYIDCENVMNIKLRLLPLAASLSSSSFILILILVYLSLFSTWSFSSTSSHLLFFSPPHSNVVQHSTSLIKCALIKSNINPVLEKRVTCTPKGEDGREEEWVSGRETAALELMWLGILIYWQQTKFGQQQHQQQTWLMVYWFWSSITWFAYHLLSTWLCLKRQITFLG